MTREEAIADIRDNIKPVVGGISLDMAIKALEQESCEDCISREAVNDLVDELARAISDERCCISRGRSTATIMQDILDLSSVTPKEKTGHWMQRPRYEGDDQPDLVCPNCGFKISWWDLGNFCAKCGTGLEGGAE